MRDLAHKKGENEKVIGCMELYQVLNMERQHIEMIIDERLREMRR